LDGLEESRRVYVRREEEKEEKKEKRQVRIKYVFYQLGFAVNLQDR
jgi:hypothetical protein